MSFIYSETRTNQPSWIKESDLPVMHTEIFHSSLPDTQQSEYTPADTFFLEFQQLVLQDASRQHKSSYHQKKE